MQTDSNQQLIRDLLETALSCNQEVVNPTNKGGKIDMPRPLTKEELKTQHRKPYDTENETFIKYGKEIKIHDFIQAGKEGTIASEIVKSAGGLKQLAHANEKLPTSDIVIDMRMDPYMANRIMKIGKIAQAKIDEAKAMAEAMAKEQQAQQAQQNNGGEQ